METSTVLLEILAANGRMNQLLLEHLDRRAWGARPLGMETREGRTIAAIFAHMHNCRRPVAHSLAGQYPDFSFPPVRSDYVAPHRPGGVGEAVGLGVSVGVGVSLGVGVSVGLGVSMDDGVWLGLGDGLGEGVGVMLSDGVRVEGDEVGDGLGVGFCRTVAEDPPRTPR